MRSGIALAYDIQWLYSTTKGVIVYVLPELSPGGESKHPLVVIGTIWSDFGDFGEIFSKVQKWYLEVSIDLFIDSNHLKTIWIWFWAFKLPLEPKNLGDINR